MILSDRATRAIQIGAVSAYLALVGIWLLLTRRVPGGGLKRIVRARLRPPFAAQFVGIRHDEGLAWIAPVPDALLSDLDSGSTLRLFEDGEPLGPPHAAHADIRLLGGGRFSHWGARVYFSTGDGTDPRINGRCYEAREVRR